MHTDSGDQIERSLHSLHGVIALLRDAWRREVPELPRAGLIALRATFLRGPLRVSDLAEVLHVDQSVASRQAKALVDEGLIETTPDPEDGRGRRLIATAAGAELVRSAHARVADAMRERIGDSWTEQELTELADSLERLHATLSTHNTPETVG